MIKYWFYIITNQYYFSQQRLHYRFWDIVFNRKPRRLRKNYIEHIAGFYCKNSGLPKRYYVNELKRKGARLWK